MKCNICGMKVEGSATGLINIEVSDGWVEVADEVSNFIHDECYALARSKAVAPELLEAAIDMVAQVEAYDHVHGRDSCSIDPDGLRLAIAKAKGDTQ